MAFNKRAATSPPRLNISEVVASRPGALPERNLEMAVWISSSESGADRSSSKMGCLMKQEKGGQCGEGIEGNNINIDLAVNQFLKVLSPTIQFVSITV